MHPEEFTALFDPPKHETARGEKRSNDENEDYQGQIQRTNLFIATIPGWIAPTQKIPNYSAQTSGSKVRCRSPVDLPVYVRLSSAQKFRAQVAHY